MPSCKSLLKCRDLEEFTERFKKKKLGGKRDSSVYISSFDRQSWSTSDAAGCTDEYSKERSLVGVK